MRDPELSSVVKEVVTNIEAANARKSQEIDTGDAASRALASLGCTACEISGECAVKEMLQDRAEQGSEKTEISNQATMTDEAPLWLKAARFNNMGVKPERFIELATDTDQTRAALKSGEINTEQWLGGVENQLNNRYVKSQLPEIQKIGTVNERREFEAHELLTAAGHRIEVIDTSQPPNPDPNQITDGSRSEYAILCSKLLSRITEVGQDGLPQIMKQDQIMQKTIGKVKGGRIDEIRMSGKNRLYFTIVDDPNGDSNTLARIVILGTHGGDQTTQARFINSINSLN